MPPSSRENSDLSTSEDEEDDKNSDEGLTSNLAKIQNRRDGNSSNVKKYDITAAPSLDRHSRREEHIVRETTLADIRENSIIHQRGDSSGFHPGLYAVLGPESENVILSLLDIAEHGHRLSDPYNGYEQMKQWIDMEFKICWKMSLSILSSCLRLRDAALAGDFVSALTLEPPVNTKVHRENVVQLRKLSIRNLKGIAQSFTDAIIETKPNLIVSEAGNVQFAAIQGRLFMALADLNLSDVKKARDMSQLVNAARIEKKDCKAGNKDGSINKLIEFYLTMFLDWRGILELLDFIMICYAGAHFWNAEELHPYCKGQDQAEHWSNQVFSSMKDLKWVKSTTTPIWASVKLQQLKMECLHEFLGNRTVCVFARASTPMPSSALYLSTDIEAFADVWGPVWAVHNETEGGPVLKYNAGLGCIVPYSHDPARYPTLLGNERLCHWRNDQCEFQVHSEL